MTDFEVRIATRGHVGDAVVRYADEKIRRAAEHAPRAVLFASATLAVEANPAMERPAVAKATLDVSGRPVRAHVAAGGIEEAIDLLEGHLRRRLEVLAEHWEAERTETGVSEPGEWRHGTLPTERPEYFPRPREEREVMRHKAYELAPTTPEEARLDMELLGYDFHLFTNADTGRENVVAREEDGSVVLADTAPVESLADALERLDVTGEPYVFFVDERARRGNVVYRRYDGHYGLITPAA